MPRSLSSSVCRRLMEFANRKNDGLLSFDEFTELLRPPEIVSQTALGDAAATLEAEAAAADELRLASAAVADGSGRMDIDADSDSESGSGSGSVSGSAPSVCPALRRAVSSTRLTLSPAYARLYEEEESARRRKADALEAAAAMALADKAARHLEQRLLSEEQARDWRLLQELRRAEAAEDRWWCASCTYKNEPSAFFCVVCETRRPEADEEKRSAPRLDRVSADEGADADAAGPAFWQCATCSYNNDAQSDACEMCSAKKPKGQARQKKTVTLWACPLCTRLVTSDRNECDVCTGDRLLRVVTATVKPCAGSLMVTISALGKRMQASTKRTVISIAPLALIMAARSASPGASDAVKFAQSLPLETSSSGFNGLRRARITSTCTSSLAGMWK